MKPASLSRLLLLFIALSITIRGQGKTENVVLITFDGARTQEVFGGLDLEILKDKTRERLKTKSGQRHTLAHSEWERTG